MFLFLDLNCLHVDFLLFNLCSVLAYQPGYEDIPGEQLSKSLYLLTVLCAAVVQVLARGVQGAL